MYERRVEYTTQEEKEQIIQDALSDGAVAIELDYQSPEVNYLVFRMKSLEQIAQEQKIMQLEAENQLLQQRIAQAQDDALFILETLFS